jgi:hypothetical protein
VAITNGYASLNEVKAALKIIDGLDDSLLEMAIESASRLIDGYAGRYFYNGGSATKNFAAQDWYITQIEDLQSITELASTDEIGGTYTTWAVTDYQLEPVNGRTDGLVSPYTRIRAVNDYSFPVNAEQALVKVTGVWGWASVPIAIKQATILQASRIFKRLDSPLGVAGFGDMGVVRVGSRLDPDVQHLVDPYRSMRNFA